MDRVVPAAEVTRWVRQAMKTKWKQQDPVHHLVSELTRKTGDRIRDIDQDSADMIIDWMEEARANTSFIKRVREKTRVELKEKDAQFGERLPAGLILK